MSHTEPGNVITVFRSRLRPEMADEYSTMAAEILTLAEQMPGFVSLSRFTADDGERLSIVVFENAETERAWRDHPRHQEAQEAGRDSFFSEYSIAVCSVMRISASSP